MSNYTLTVQYGSGKIVRIKMRRVTGICWKMCPPYLGVSEEQLQSRARDGSPGKEAGYTSVYIK